MLYRLEVMQRTFSRVRLTQRGPFHDLSGNEARKRCNTTGCQEPGPTILATFNNEEEPCE